MAEEELIGQTKAIHGSSLCPTQNRPYRFGSLTFGHAANPQEESVQVSRSSIRVSWSLVRFKEEGYGQIWPKFGKDPLVSVTGG